LCTSPCNLLSSPVKSESSESQKSCEAWSDLIEQDEQESKVAMSNLDKTLMKFFLEIVVFLAKYLPVTMVSKIIYLIE
jgi:hypothetical protein